MVVMDKELCFHLQAAAEGQTVASFACQVTQVEGSVEGPFNSLCVGPSHDLVQGDATSCEKTPALFRMCMCVFLLFHLESKPKSFLRPPKHHWLCPPQKPPRSSPPPPLCLAFFLSPLKTPGFFALTVPSAWNLNYLPSHSLTSFKSR